MDNQAETLHGLEDEYLDDLIRLAVKRERMQEAEEILRLSREPVSPEEESRLDRIWSQAYFARSQALAAPTASTFGV